MTDNTQDAGTLTELKDSIEQEVVINASVDSVWHLVSVPGWWLVDCAEDDMRRLRESGGPSVLLSGFKVETLESTEPRAASFRWTWTEDRERPTTEVDFHLDETSGGTRVRVIETGLSVGGSAQLLATHYAENLEGWHEQLHLLRRHAEGEL